MAFTEKGKKLSYQKMDLRESQDDKIYIQNTTMKFPPHYPKLK